MLTNYSQKENFNQSVGKQVEIERIVKELMQNRGVKSLYTNYLMLYGKKIYKSNDQESLLNYNTWVLRGLMNGWLTRLSELIKGKAYEQTADNKKSEALLYLNFYNFRDDLWFLPDLDLSGNKVLIINQFCEKRKGLLGHGCYFSGNGTRIVATANEDFNLLLPLSISMWFKSDLTNTYETFIEKGRVVIDEGGLQILRWNNGYNDFIRVRIINTLGYFFDVDSLPLSLSSKWYNLVITFESAGNKTKVKIFLDSKLVGWSDDATGYVGTLIYELGIGASWRESSYFQGTLDEIRFTKKVLSVEEIEESYKAEKPFVN